MISGERELNLTSAADLLLDARRTSTPIADLPGQLQPTSLEEAYFVQDTMARAFGDIGGWKVGAPTPEAEPSFAPMPKAWIASSGSLLRGIPHRYRGLEAEIAFLFGADLPLRETPYTLDEVVAAIASMHPAVEVLETGFTDPGAVARLTSTSDMALHGGFVYGAAVPDWQTIDFTRESVTMVVDGMVRVERTGSNTAGNLMRLLPWLANEGARRTGGLRAGDWVTTGSWTGNTLATSGSTVAARFSTAGLAELRFA